MRLVSFRHGDRAGFGAVEGEAIHDLGSSAPDLRALLARADGIEAARRLIDGGGAPRIDFAAVDWVPVIPNPDKIICVGVNYRDHMAETGRKPTEHPTLFLRLALSQIGHGQPIVRPRESEQLDFEGELAVVIGRGGRRINAADALRHVAGYACYHDATVRDWQRHSSQFTPGKNFPATGAFGPWLVTADEIPDPRSLALTTRVNGQVMQQAPVSDLIFDIPALIAYISCFTELAPGDVIVTGTPGGVGFTREPPIFLKPGDEVAVTIDKIGTLSNRVIDG